MKKIMIVVTGLFLMTFSSYGDVNFDYNPRTDTALDISVSVPPAILWVVDSEGNITGADPSLSVNSIGEQTQIFPAGLTNIPDSNATQDNEIDPQTNECQSTTFWEIIIKTTMNQAYILNVKGLKNGISTIVLGQLYPGPISSSDRINYSVLSTVGITRQYEVAFNPSLRTVNVTPMVSNDNLLADVQTACSLNLITSHRTCENLEREATLIDEALDHNRNEEAKALTLTFLHYLGDSRPWGCRDEDEHLDIKEPALTILKDDAKALLAQLGGKDHDYHHGN